MKLRCRVWSAGAALAAAVVVVVAFPAGAAQAAASVSGGGSTFAAPELQQFASDTSGAPYDLQVNYAATGSGAGRENYAQGTYQYGTSDIVFTPNDGPLAADAATKHPYRYVTVTAGGLGFMYNIVIGGQRWTGLNLTRQDVCQIFTGAITTWNDPRLVSTPGDAILASVDKHIQPVVRSDQAGESYVLSQYCLAIDRGDWLTFVNYVLANRSNETGAGWNGDQDLAPAGNPNQAEPIEYWPPLLDGNDNAIIRSGASNLVQYVVDPNTGSNSITYVAAVYAKDAGFPMASVQNQAGDFVQPNANSVQLALSYAKANASGTFDLDFSGPNPAAYFPSTYSYILAPTSTNAPASAGVDQSMAEFLCYSVGQGQNDAAPLLYAPLSREVTAISVQAIEAIPGAPSASQCGIGGPAPAVTPGQVVGNNGNAGPSGGGGGSGGGAGGTGGSGGASGSNSSGGAETGGGGTGSGAGSSASGSGSEAGGAGSSAAVTAAAGRRSGGGATNRTGAQAGRPGASAGANGGPVSVPLQAIAVGSDQLRDVLVFADRRRRLCPRSGPGFQEGAGFNLMARVSGRRVHRRWRLALRALTGAAAVLWVLSPYMDRAGATTTPLPTVNLYGEGGWDVATEVTNWHNGVYAATAADPVDTHYVLEGDLNAQTDFLTGTADYLISGVPFQAKSSTGLPGGASNVIAAPIMSTGLGALVVAPLTGFQNIKLNSTITYGPLSEARPAPPDGTPPIGCPAPGCPPINVPNLNLVAMVDSFAGQFQQDQNGNLWTDDYWSNPQIYGSWDQSALQYNAAEGDSLVPQVAPDPITRSDPNDENYYFERWAGAVAPSIWKYPGSPNEFMPVSFADEFQGPGLASEIGLIQQEGGVGGFGGGGAVALVPPSGLSDLYATETSQPYSLTNEPTIAQWIGVQNANGDFVTPNPAAVEAGVDAGAAAGETACSATNQNALYAATNKVPGAYPLAWVDCLYAPTKGLSMAKTDALAGFIRYLVTDGQIRSTLMAMPPFPSSTCSRAWPPPTRW